MGVAYHLPSAGWGRLELRVPSGQRPGSPVIDPFERLADGDVVIPAAGTKDRSAAGVVDGQIRPDRVLKPRGPFLKVGTCTSKTLGLSAGNCVRAFSVSSIGRHIAQPIANHGRAMLDRAFEQPLASV
jgi:hypothetical protein